MLRFDRSITISERIDNGVDEYGNTVYAHRTTHDIQARRERSSAYEQTVDQDRQVEVFTYYLGPYTQINGRGYIIDGSQRLEVIGEPEVFKVVSGQVHHIRIDAKLVTG